MIQNYPEEPGYKAKATETSSKAAAEIKGRAATLRDKCLNKISVNDGMTADEVAASLYESVLSVRPRLSELVAQNKIEDSGTRRKNASGKTAVVWRLKQVVPDNRILKQVELL